MSPRETEIPGHAGGAHASSIVGEVDDGWVTSRPPKLVEAFLRVFLFPRILVRHRDLIVSSVKRELASRFQGTLLGFLWPLVHPLFIFAVYYFIFTKLLSFKMPNLQPGQESAMGVYMFIGVLVWAAFGESLGRGCNVIVENGNLIKKLAFPSEVLPLNIVMANIVTMLFGVAMYLVATIFTSVWEAPGIELLWIPVLLVLQILFTYGLAMFLATLQVFLRDTAQVVAIVVTVWMFLTPLFWVPEAIPQIGGYLPFIEGNPMNHLVFAWREVLMGVDGVLAEVLNYTNDVAIPYQNAKVDEALAAGLVPEVGKLDPLVYAHSFLGSIKAFAAWSVGTFIAGYTFFIVAQRRFADEV
ncbi:MAG: ABC transporter permease [Planctomycetota bacterium]|nr:ABC transporter permease [Planctomycetota bacterium]